MRLLLLFCLIIKLRIFSVPIKLHRDTGTLLGKTGQWDPYPFQTDFEEVFRLS